MSFEEILKSLKDKSYKPLFTDGEEPYYIDVLTDYIEANVLSEDEKALLIRLLSMVKTLI